MIHIKNLSKSFGAKTVLSGLNLHLEKGKAYGIVGENGAGKTTLFRCITGMESYDGSIESDFSPLKNHIGFLPTNPVFMSRITGWEYLKLLTIARGIHVSDFEERNVFDLPLGQYVETYSTGMKKKVALMGVLLQKNEIYILDEPFNGVDIHSNMIISAIIGALKSAGKTILISSHIFSTLSDNCDEIHHLKNGILETAVGREAFLALEEEMKAFVVGNSIERLKLT